MVAPSQPTLADVYRLLCQQLQKHPALAVNVVNHIAAKHKVYTLPAFHSSDAISDADKLATYGELFKALNSYCNLGDKGALAKLQGQRANGQAQPEGKGPEMSEPIDLSPRDNPPTKTTDPTPEPPPAKPAPPKPAPKSSDPLTERLREIIIELIGEQTAVLDEDKVRGIAHVCAQKQAKAEVDSALAKYNEVIDAAIKAAIKAVEPAAPTVVRHEFKVGEAINATEDLMHRQIPQVIAWLTADVPVWLWGSAGGSKTHSARQIAGLMGLPFYCAPIDETITVGKLIGYRNVTNGEFVEGLVYKAFKFGGVLLLDEGDMNATALAAGNSMMSNNHYTFPNGEEVTRHKNFRLILGGNTKGTGAVAGYTARVRLDAATLDRFAVIKMEYDNGLEIALCCGGPNTSVPWTKGKPASEPLCRRYVEWIQKVRSKVGESVLISPRASYLGVRALRVGITPAEVAEALVFKLVTDDTRRRIINEAGTVPTE